MRLPVAPGLALGLRGEGRALARGFGGRFRLSSWREPREPCSRGVSDHLERAMAGSGRSVWQRVTGGTWRCSPGPACGAL